MPADVRTRFGIYEFPSLTWGTAWAAELYAQYLGAQSGLGYVIVYSEQFAYLDRVFVVALPFHIVRVDQLRNF
jgi:ABC-type nitrate/sulfonate/bicarbonate transport system permease component